LDLRGHILLRGGEGKGEKGWGAKKEKGKGKGGKGKGEGVRAWKFFKEILAPDHS